MISELILREERNYNEAAIFGLGIVCSAVGSAVSMAVIPSGSGYTAAAFAALAIVTPLHRYLFSGDTDRVIKGTGIYIILFAGIATGFTAVSAIEPDVLTAQGTYLSGNATSPASFSSLLLNNMTVFVVTGFLSTVLGSAGAFVLAWNASVMGKFFGSKVSNGLLVSGCEASPGVICYLPHSLFEITGFATAGIAGTLVSGAVISRKMDKPTWIKITEICLFGVGLIVTGAAIESKGLLVSTPLVGITVLISVRASRHVTGR
jgi:uncharacterized membrane protein SpoIIM required for sporulation